MASSSVSLVFLVGKASSFLPSVQPQIGIALPVDMVLTLAGGLAVHSHCSLVPGALFHVRKHGQRCRR